MSDFEVLVLGVGDTFSEQHRSTSLLLTCDGFHLGIDCPDMYRGVLRDAARAAGRPITLDQVDHVLVTHVHGDHMNGLEGVAFFKHFAEGKKLTLLAAPEVRDVIWDQRLAAPMGQLWTGSEMRSMHFDDYFVHVPLSWTEAVQVGPFRIRTRRTVHHVPTTALLIEAGGRTLGYSADTAFDPTLIDWLSAADLIVHETNFGPAHTPYEKLAELPESLRQRMRLVHYSDLFDAEASVIPVLHEGQTLVV